MALFNDAPKGRTKKAPKLQYGTAERARATLKRIRQLSPTRQKQMARSMYYRAKYHAQQTNGMRAAMKVYAKFLKKAVSG